MAATASSQAPLVRPRSLPAAPRPSRSRRLLNQGDNANGTWSVRVNTTNAFTGGGTNSTPTTAGALNNNAFAYWITSAVVAGSAATVGAACPCAEQQRAGRQLARHRDLRHQRCEQQHRSDPGHLPRQLPQRLDDRSRRDALGRRNVQQHTRCRPCARQLDRDDRGGWNQQEHRRPHRFQTAEQRPDFPERRLQRIRLSVRDRAGGRTPPRARSPGRPPSRPR